MQAHELLNREAERLGGIRENKPPEVDLRWAYSVSAAWLVCRSDPATVERYVDEGKVRRAFRRITETSTPQLRLILQENTEYNAGSLGAMRRPDLTMMVFDLCLDGNLPDFTEQFPP